MSTVDDALFDARAYSPHLNLEDRFGAPPFTILDAASGRWRERRRWWDAHDLESTSGRSTHLTFTSDTATDEVSAKIAASGTTSVFDPVLCELALRWWSPPRGVILDPFAGGSTRGVVSAILGREYYGVDLSRQQIDANEDTARRLRHEFIGPAPEWHEHDSSKWQPTVRADMILSCPPYGNLERYSDDPRDLSAMDWASFRDAYQRAIAKSVNRLRNDRFAVFVVGNYRDGAHFRDLVGVTVSAFGEAGADYYGDLVLKSGGASAGLRASASFPAGRKPIRVHQMVLVFVKGDWRAASAAAEPFPESGAIG